ncbi:hypothetical protein Hamer_G013488 [Homarus americanus]|uniref:Uncharacterized protein n=1 Tax=Homarus americanus TaxID=6706 RepID=A0A8J5KG91_HOMAM|nr:hypothetical protein Hamer_G013488 [Homarus americanus]
MRQVARHARKAAMPAAHGQPRARALRRARVGVAHALSGGHEGSEKPQDPAGRRRHLAWWGSSSERRDLCAQLHYILREHCYVH